MKGVGVILAALLLVVFIITPIICAELAERDRHDAAFVVEWIGSIVVAVLLVANVIVWTL